MHMMGNGPPDSRNPLKQAVVVRLAEVWKVYGDGATAVTALRDVTADFASGTFTAIMGPSGSGKTTLLQCAAGLAEPSKGTVLGGEANLVGMSEHELAVLRRLRMGFVFQEFNLLPALTGRENIVLPLRLAGHK
jgi:putative ABC transport system ATP-binding protein